MAKRVSLIYERPQAPLEGEGLDKIVSLTESIQEATTVVQSRYSDVKLHIYHGTHHTRMYTAFFEGKNGEEITKAMDDFIRLAGVPYSVEGKYSLMDGVLAPYGKKLVRDIFALGGGIQKFVRDVKA